MEKRFGTTAPSAASQDDGCIFIVGNDGAVYVIVTPHPDGSYNHEYADAILELLSAIEVK